MANLSLKLAFLLVVLTTCSDAAMEYACKFRKEGAVYDGSHIWLFSNRWGKTREECATACINMKRENRYINGVSYTDSTRCVCYTGMTGFNQVQSKWAETCILTPIPVYLGYDCQFRPGIGHYKGFLPLGKMEEQECVYECTLRKEIKPKYNGVNYYVSSRNSEHSRKCFCLYGMTGDRKPWVTSSAFKTCFLAPGSRPTVARVAYDCTFHKGMAIYKGTMDLGKGYNGEECKRACVQKKRTNTKINGVAHDDYSNCYCFEGMTGVDPDKFPWSKACILTPAADSITTTAVPTES